MRRSRLGSPALLLVALALAGCATARIGTPPPVARLASLTPGVSTPADVLLVLGQPRGDGALRSSTLPEPRTLWFYQYLEAQGGKSESMRLLVFFRADRYEGYLWFSSVKHMKSEP